MTAKKKPVQEKKKEIPTATECAKVSKGKGKDKAEAKQKAAAELASELKKLRATLKEIVRQVNLRIEGSIAETLRVLEKKQAPGEPCSLPGAKASLQLAKKLQKLKLHPAKGKMKDVAHIGQMAEKIAGKMPKK